VKSQQIVCLIFFFFYPEAVNGCLLEIKLPLRALGYAPQDLTVTFRDGDIVKFECFSTDQVTFNLTGSPKIQCDGDQWSSKPPKCKGRFVLHLINP